MEHFRSATLEELQRRVEELYADSLALRNSEVEALLGEVRRRINLGELRSATLEGEWKAIPWLRKALALHTRFGRLEQAAPGAPVDLDLLPRRRFSINDGVRVTDASCFVRDGAYLAPGVTLLPAAVVQMGAWIGPGAVIHNAAGVGVCAVVGQRAQVGAGAQIQGHILPHDALPAIIGDGATIGANCVIGNRVVIGPEAMVLAGTILMQYTPIFDPVKKQRVAGTDTTPLVVPPKAIVAPGSRAMAHGVPSDLLMSAAVGVIVGYTDDPNLPVHFLDKLLEK